jgi:small subunit ribosomal protein S7e
MQYLFDLENTNQELKSDLKDLYINSAMYAFQRVLLFSNDLYIFFTNYEYNLFNSSQMDISGNRKAVVIYVPYRLRKSFRKIHPRLVRELEKKFSGKVMCYSFYFYALSVIIWFVVNVRILFGKWCSAML